MQNADDATAESDPLHREATDYGKQKCIMEFGHNAPARRARAWKDREQRHEHQQVKQHDIGFKHIRTGAESISKPREPTRRHSDGDGNDRSHRNLQDEFNEAAQVQQAPMEEELIPDHAPGPAQSVELPLLMAYLSGRCRPATATSRCWSDARAKKWTLGSASWRSASRRPRRG